MHTMGGYIRPVPTFYDDVVFECWKCVV